MTAYYNEIDAYAAQWLRNLIAAGHIAPGDVDERSIVDVRADDLKGYSQCHFFAGIGGWSISLRLAGWSDRRQVWTGSCPCQPFSSIGKKTGFADERHLWPVWRELIRECVPPVVFGEQVANAAEWLGHLRSDLEAMDYAVGAMPIEAASAGADDRRDRFWFVADTSRGEARPQESGHSSSQAHSRQSLSPSPVGGCVDLLGKRYRRPQPEIRLLADGISTNVALLRPFGNAIDPRVGAQVIGAYMEIAA